MSTAAGTTLIGSVWAPAMGGATARDADGDSERQGASAVATRLMVANRGPFSRSFNRSGGTLSDVQASCRNAQISSGEPPKWTLVASGHQLGYELRHNMNKIFKRVDAEGSPGQTPVGPPARVPGSGIRLWTSGAPLLVGRPLPPGVSAPLLLRGNQNNL
jgi:hypothetical protein